MYTLDLNMNKITQLNLLQTMKTYKKVNEMNLCAQKCLQ